MGGQDAPNHPQHGALHALLPPELVPILIANRTTVAAVASAVIGVGFG